MLSEEHISNVTKTSSNQYRMVFSPYCFPHTGETCFSVWTREFLSQISLWKESLHSLLQMLLGKNETSKKNSRTHHPLLPGQRSISNQFISHSPWNPRSAAAEGKNEAEGEWHRGSGQGSATKGKEPAFSTFQEGVFRIKVRCTKTKSKPRPSEHEQTDRLGPGMLCCSDCIWADVSWAPPQKEYKETTSE